MNLLQNFLINIIENVKRKSSELVLLMSGLIIYSNFTLEKSTLNMKKFASVKIHSKIILAKRNLELNYLRFLCYSKKHALICPALYRVIFQSLYRPPKQKVEEGGNFWNFCTLFKDTFATFLCHFGTPFSNEKTKWQTKRSMLQWSLLMGKFM